MKSKTYYIQKMDSIIYIGIGRIKLSLGQSFNHWVCYKGNKPNGRFICLGLPFIGLSLYY